MTELVQQGSLHLPGRPMRPMTEINHDLPVGCFSVAAKCVFLITRHRHHGHLHKQPPGQLGKVARAQPVQFFLKPLLRPAREVVGPVGLSLTILLPPPLSALAVVLYEQAGGRGRTPPSPLAVRATTAQPSSCQ